jgi:hypothetical protein
LPGSGVDALTPRGKRTWHSGATVAFLAGRRHSALVAYLADVFLAVLLRARVAVAFLAGTLFAGVFVARVRLAAVAFFCATRAVVGLGFFVGVFAAVTPVARLLAVATFFAAAVPFPGAFLAPVAFLALAGLVAVRVLPPLPPGCSVRDPASPSAISAPPRDSRSPTSTLMLIDSRARLKGARPPARTALSAVSALPSAELSPLG